MGAGLQEERRPDGLEPAGRQRRLHLVRELRLDAGELLLRESREDGARAADGVRRGGRRGLAREEQRERAREQEGQRRDREERPAIVDQRSRLGDWEGDTVVGKGRLSGLVTLVERKSGFALVKVVRRLASRNVTRAIARATNLLPPELKQTLTLDNGKEFARHAALQRQTGLAIYFARPYHAWERGSNEHFNGLLRAYFPKGTDFRRTAASEVQHVLDQLNDRPRQRLGYQTPREVLAQDFHVANEM